mgnify:FL=1
MLVNSKAMLLKAKKNNTAVFHFNINNLEWTKYILEECNKLKTDVILGVSESAIAYMGGEDVVYALVMSLIKDLHITIDVCLHLDHGKSFESCKRCIDAGWPSVMIDASKYSYEENVALTKKVVDYAHERNVTVEAEIGHVGSIVNNACDDILLPSVSECYQFVHDTNIDSLAPSIGTVHGIYKGKLNISFSLIQELSQKLDIPLVMHGGSGLNDLTLKKAVKCGINKININSDIQYAWYKDVRNFIKNNDSVYDPRKVISSGKDAIYHVVEQKINILK